MVGLILDCDYGGFVVDSGWWGILHLFIFINIVGVFLNYFNVLYILF